MFGTHDESDLFRERSMEWNRLLKKIAKDCEVCDGLGLVPVKGQGKGKDCPVCIPKAQTITYLKESGMNVQDVQRGNLTDPTILQQKAIFIQGEMNEREILGFGFLKEEAKVQRKVFYTEMSNLVGILKNGNKDLIRFDTIFIDGVDMYKHPDQFILPYFDGLLFKYKNDPKKKILVGGLNNSDGYANRFLEIFGTRFKHLFV